MIKQNKTKLQFAFGAILFLSVAVSACNNDGEKKETVKNESTTTTVKRDSMIKGGKVSPVEVTKPQ